MIEYENLAKSNSQFMDAFKIASAKTIESGWYILGESVEKFEDRWAEYLDVEHCIGVGNGLDALILSFEAFEFRTGSEVLVASNTYIATILAIIKAGLKPVLVEPELETFNLDPDFLHAAMTPNTRAICVTHMFGKPCRMTEIVDFAKEHGLKLVEDAAQSHGAKYNGISTGSFGDFGCHSFYPTKNLGALGDGGAITTNDAGLADKIRHLRNYGSTQKYVNDYLGTNSRLDEIQAAFLAIKLTKLDELTKHKRELADVYFNNLPGWLSLPLKRSNEYDVFHIFGIRSKNRDKLREWLLQNAVKTEVHYPIAPHKQKAMQGILNGEFPISDELHKTQLSLPISYGHTKEDIMHVCELLHSAPKHLMG